MGPTSRSAVSLGNLLEQSLCSARSAGTNRRSSRVPLRRHQKGTLRAMKATIEAGRLVIPRALRDRVGLTLGGEVDLVVDGATIRVEPIAGRRLAQEDGFFVIPASGTTLNDEAVREMRGADRHLG